MVIVDTSIWVDHLYKGNSELEYLLNENKAATHPFIIGELACGAMKNRNLIVSLLIALPTSDSVTQEEFLLFIEKNKLYGRGLGFVDIHILASAAISNYKIFTRDKDLIAASEKLGIKYM
jgi:predicted nucleic acid-binding protein